MANIEELLTADNNSLFIFNKCVGAAAILEFTGTAIQIILANDKFFEMNGGSTDEVRVNTDETNQILSVSDTDKLNKTIQRATKNGEAKCEVFIKPTKRWIEVRYYLVSKGYSTSLVFCQMEDITKEYLLQEKINNIQREMQVHLDLMPGGTFKYEADGEQKFEYISNGVPALLGYESVGLSNCWQG